MPFHQVVATTSGVSPELQDLKNQCHSATPSCSTQVTHWPFGRLTCIFAKLLLAFCQTIDGRG